MFFHGHGVALQTVSELREANINADILEFIQTTLPSSKKDKTELALLDKAMAQGINSKLGVKCVSGDLYLELFRGIRQHLSKYLVQNQEEKITQGKISQANLGLGHALARNQIKFDERKQDKTIINSFSLLEQMEKNLNTFAMRLKEGYSWHFPELAKVIVDNETYAKLVHLVGNKENIKDVDIQELNALTGDEEVSKQVIERAKSSMGNTLGEIDEEQIKEFALYVINHFEYKRNLQEYIKKQMMTVAPNLTTILGEAVGAKLLTHAGGLSNLAKLPSSTVQILGAEKALFRAIRKKGNTPKYGLLFNSSYIQKAKAIDKGKVSRMLANKCALASRMDFFLQKPSDKFGAFFKEQLQEKLLNPQDQNVGKQNIERMEKIVKRMIKKGEYVKEAEN